MLVRKRRKPYWRQTKWQILFAVGVPCIAVVGALLMGPKLDGLRFLGFPLGFFLACHGSMLLGVVATARFVARQDQIDQIHGANEDY